MFYNYNFDAHPNPFSPRSYGQRAVGASALHAPNTCQEDELIKMNKDLNLDNTSETSRRSLISKVGIGAVATAFLSTMGPVGEVLIGKRARAQTAITDVDILNFALNLEYLEAEYYLRGVTGTGLANGLVTGTGSLGGVNGGTMVPFNNSVFAQISTKIAQDEQAHVAFLRSALGSAAIARPLIDLAGGFQGAAVAAGIATAAAPFSPFANEVNFMLGAFALEEVGVTAYAGAAALLTNPAYLSAAASILAVEAYHSGSIRGLLAQTAAGVGTATDVAQGSSIPFATQAIANLQSQASGALTAIGIINPANGEFQISSRDGNALAYRRTTTQVINIVENGSGASHKGGFFPNGLNGKIT